MTITRTRDFVPDTDFEAFAEITKSVTGANGKRYLVGVASGVEEDRDGERVTENCIKSMIAQIRSGGVKLTGSHQQDWMTTIGDVIEGDHDPDTGEMIVKAELPMEGEDALADKAWNLSHSGRKFGFSIGGKLTAAFFERSSETGKRRKALDGVALRHLCLTEKPAYAPSFATAVAKTWEPAAPVDDEFTIEIEFVEKDNAGAAPGRSGQDSAPPTGDRRPGKKKPGEGAPMRTDGKDPDQDSSDDDQDDVPATEQLPNAERHLACPACGHEFAADLPDDNELSPDNPSAQLDGRVKGNNTTSKTAEEPDMPLTDSLDSLRALVEKTGEAPEATAETAVAEAPDVAKAATVELDTTVAKAVLETNELLAETREQMAEAFTLIAKSHKDLIEEVRKLPQGRKSVARQLPAAVGHAEGDVAKTLDEQIKEAPSLVDALKIANAQHPRYAHLS